MRETTESQRQVFRAAWRRLREECYAAHMDDVGFLGCLRPALGSSLKKQPPLVWRWWLDEVRGDLERAAGEPRDVEVSD